MKILFLDDSPDRIEEFRKREPGAIIVETAHECIDLLRDPAVTWDEVHLDHDLNRESWCDSARKDTGMEVVRFICLSKPDILTCIVHSHNTVAAPHMVRALRTAGYYTVAAPFSYRNDVGDYYYSSDDTWDSDYGDWIADQIDR